MIRDASLVPVQNLRKNKCSILYLLLFMNAVKYLGYEN